MRLSGRLNGWAAHWAATAAECVCRRECVGGWGVLGAHTPAAPHSNWMSANGADAEATAATASVADLVAQVAALRLQLEAQVATVAELRAEVHAKDATIREKDASICALREKVAAVEEKASASGGDSGDGAERRSEPAHSTVASPTTAPPHATAMTPLSSIRQNARATPKSARKRREDAKKAEDRRRYAETQPRLEAADVTLRTIVSVWLERKYSKKNEWESDKSGCEAMRALVHAAAVVRPKVRRDDAEFAAAVEAQRAAMVAAARGHAPPHGSITALRECARAEFRRLWRSEAHSARLGALQLLLYCHATLVTAPRLIEYGDDGLVFFFFATSDKTKHEELGALDVPRLAPCTLFSAAELRELDVSTETMAACIGAEYRGSDRRRTAMRGFQALSTNLALAETRAKLVGDGGCVANWHRRLAVLLLDAELDGVDDRHAASLRRFVDEHLPRGRVQLFNLALGHTVRERRTAAFGTWALTSVSRRRRRTFKRTSTTSDRARAWRPAWRSAQIEGAHLTDLCSVLLRLGTGVQNQKKIAPPASGPSKIFQATSPFRVGRN